MVGEGDGMQLDVTGEVFHWRGPSPHHFVAVPDAESAVIKDLSAGISYGWGMVPVSATVGGTTFTTALFPKNGRYLIPLKDAVRHAEEIGLGDSITVSLTIGGAADPAPARPASPARVPATPVQRPEFEW